MKANEKRKARSYKVRDGAYKKALKRGQKENCPLAQLLEKVVALYADGYTIAFYDKIPQMASKID